MKARHSCMASTAKKAKEQSRSRGERKWEVKGGGGGAVARRSISSDSSRMYSLVPTPKITDLCRGNNSRSKLAELA